MVTIFNNLYLHGKMLFAEVYMKHLQRLDKKMFTQTVSRGFLIFYVSFQFSQTYKFKFG